MDFSFTSPKHDQRLVDGVQGGRADIAIDDTERGQHQGSGAVTATIVDRLERCARHGSTNILCECIRPRIKIPSKFGDLSKLATPARAY